MSDLGRAVWFVGAVTMITATGFFLEIWINSLELQYDPIFRLITMLALFNVGQIVWNVGASLYKRGKKIRLH